MIDTFHPLEPIEPETTTVVVVISHPAGSWESSSTLKPHHLSTLTPDEDAVTNLYRTVRRTILLVFMSLFILSTTVLNLGALLVLFRPVFRKNVYAFGQKFLAVQNIAFALVIGTGFFVMGVGGSNIEDWHQEYCVAFMTMFFILSACTNWTVVFLTGIRYMSIKYPMNFHNGLFYKGAYISVLAMSIFMSALYSVLYTNMYWFAQVVEEEYERKSSEQCYRFLLNDIGTLLFLSLFSLLETALPVVCVVYLNVRIIGASGDVNKNKVLLRQELNVISTKLYTLRRSLATPPAGLQPLPSDSETHMLMPENSTYDYHSVDGPSQLTAPVTPSPNLRPVSRYGSKTSKLLSQNSNTAMLNASEDGMTRIQREIERQRRDLHRASLAYHLLCETSAISEKSIRLKSPERPRKSSEQAPAYFLCGAKCCKCPLCHGCGVTIKRCLVLSTVLFMVLNLPYCLWFIFSSSLPIQTSKDLALSRLLSAIFISLKVFSHLTYTLIYIYGSQKFQIENSRFMRKYLCVTRRRRFKS